MKLGTQTGSLINHLHSRSANPTPEIGMGATLLSWTDRNPGTVISIEDKGSYQIIGVQEDDYQRTDDRGFSEMQDYEYTANPNGYVTYFRNRKGKWEGCRKSAETGRWVKAETYGLKLGFREKYHDFTF